MPGPADLGLNFCPITSWLCGLGPGHFFLTSLKLSFLICEMEIVTTSTSLKDCDYSFVNRID